MEKDYEEIPKENLVSLSTINKRMLPTYRNPADELDKKMLEEELSKAMNYLNARDIKVLEYRLGLEGERALTLEETGKVIGVTGERVRQIQAKALRKIKKKGNIKILEDFL